MARLDLDCGGTMKISLVHKCKYRVFRPAECGGRVNNIIE